MKRSQIKNKVFLKSIAIEIKKLREKKGLTQEDFYNDTAIHIGRVETGNVGVSITTLYEICQYLEIPVSKFLKQVEENL